MGIGDCFENINIPPCIWFEGGNRRNSYAAMLSGLLVRLNTNKVFSTYFGLKFSVFCWLVGYY